jgi:hypothetical protein
VAFTFYLGAIFINGSRFGLMVGLEWFVPAFFLKLLIGYLLPERPYPTG